MTLHLTPIDIPAPRPDGFHGALVVAGWFGLCVVAAEILCWGAIG